MVNPRTVSATDFSCRTLNYSNYREDFENRGMPDSSTIIPAELEPLLPELAAMLPTVTPASSDSAKDYGPDAKQRIARAWGADRPCTILAEIPSTQDETRRLAPAAGQAPLLVVASRQSAGRGTRGRSWSQDGHDDLSFSFVVEPSYDPRLLPMLVSVAVRASLLRFLPGRERDLRLKWPNDCLVVDGRPGHASKKLAGILIESLDRGRWIVGVGINVNRLDFPSELEDSASSLRLVTGRHVDRADLLAVLLEQLNEFQRAASDGAVPAILSLYEASLMLIGRRVRVRCPQSSSSGVLAQITTEAVRLEDGRQFSPGEVQGLEEL